ncbi:MAG TPA: pyruvate kinase [Candidatus Saccharimonadales bacterium]|nr:pyruvate kinase [Candidatus Saccharimonadales bacterium]
MSAEVGVASQFPFPTLEHIPSVPLVVATLGPATDSVIDAIAAQAEIARIHGVHNPIDKYEQRAAAFLAAPNPHDRDRRVFADLEGFGVRTSPNTRTRVIGPGDIVEFLFQGYGEVDGVVNVQDDVSQFVETEHLVSMGDSKVWMTVEDVVKGGIVRCRVNRTPRDEAWELVANKGINFPQTEFPDVLIDRDIERMHELADSAFVPDYIGLSFTQTPELLEQARKLAHQLGMHSVNFIVKIENQVGARNVRSIIEALDGGDATMAAFGDMVPELVHKPKITNVLVDIHTYSAYFRRNWMACTGLGQSLLESPEPSTSETVALGLIARLGGWLCLSGDELAMNFKYPVQAVQALRDIVDESADLAALTLAGMPKNGAQR